MGSDLRTHDPSDEGGAVATFLRRSGIAGPLEYAGQLVHGLAHPELLRSGATVSEERARLPGDGLIREPVWTATRAETVCVSPAEVWPWLLQMGWGRAGWYAWFPFSRPHQAIPALHPEWATLHVGDVLLDSPDCDPETGAWRVVALEPERHVVLRSRRTLGKAREQPGPGRTPWIDSSWTFVLLPLAGTRTRMLVRTRVSLSPRWAFVLIRYLFGPGDTVMQRTMLQGIKRGAERASADPVIHRPM